jgi:hypothetical protein
MHRGHRRYPPLSPLLAILQSPRHFPLLSSSPLARAPDTIVVFHQSRAPARHFPYAVDPSQPPGRRLFESSHEAESKCCYVLSVAPTRAGSYTFRYVYRTRFHHPANPPRQFFTLLLLPFIFPEQTSSTGLATADGSLHTRFNTTLVLLRWGYCAVADITAFSWNEEPGVTSDQGVVVHRGRSTCVPNRVRWSSESSSISGNALSGVGGDDRDWIWLGRSEKCAQVVVVDGWRRRQICRRRTGGGVILG